MIQITCLYISSYISCVTWRKICIYEGCLYVFICLGYIPPTRRWTSHNHNLLLKIHNIIKATISHVQQVSACFKKLTYASLFGSIWMGPIYKMRPCFCHVLPMVYGGLRTEVRLGDDMRRTAHGSEAGRWYEEDCAQKWGWAMIQGGLRTEVRLGDDTRRTAHRSEAGRWYEDVSVQIITDGVWAYSVTDGMFIGHEGNMQYKMLYHQEIPRNPFH